MSKEKGADQTEKPTDKKLKDARKEGQIHKSQDLSKTLTLLLWLLCFIILAPTGMDLISHLFQITFQAIPSATPQSISTILSQSIIIMVFLTLPVLTILSLVGTFIEFLQAGPVFSLKKVKPNLNHLNPTEGIKRMFSQKNLIEAIKAIFKTGALITVVYIIAKDQFPEYLKIIYTNQPKNALIAHSDTIIIILSMLIIVFFFVSVLDTAYQRHAFMKELMMSKRDIKQEHKENEGDPLVKGQRKQLHQEWSQQNMLSAVRKSNVVVVNPTHVAVALYYDQEETELPMVVAKGEGYMAQLIRKTAEEEGIPIMQNIDLARGLNRTIALDSYITPDFFEPVAELLKWAKETSDKAKEEGVLPRD